MPAAPNKKKDGAETPPDVERHDEVYFRHASGPKAGRVLSRGEHGVVIEADGKRHKVRWDGILGHKAKAPMTAKVVDQGDDGLIVADDAGRRRYIHDPIKPPAGGPLAKSHLPAVILFGAGVGELAKAIKGRPGLTLQDITDKSGKHSKRWKKDGADVKRPSAAAAAKPAAKEPAARPAPGDAVKFRAGDADVEGHVVGEPGPKGAHVKDASGREHQVEWTAMGPAKPKPEPKAANDAAATEGDDGEAPMFPPELVAKLPKTQRQPFNDWDQLSEAAGPALEEYTEKLGGVAAALGLRTGKKPKEMEPGPEGYLFIGPLKEKERATQKAAADYDGDVDMVRDVVRATISVATFAELRKAVEAVRAAGLEVAQQPKDRFVKPSDEGYRDLLTVVRLPGGMLAELQYHLKPITAAKAEGHSLYKVERDLQAKYGEDKPTDQWSNEDHASFYDSVSKQREIYEKAWKNASTPLREKPESARPDTEGVE